MRSAGSGIETAAGEGALLEAALRPADWVMAAISGAAGLRRRLRRSSGAPPSRSPTRNAWFAPAGFSCAGRPPRGATILPVDSEHNAIFQALSAGRREEVRRVDPHRLGRPVPHLERGGDRGGDAGAGARVIRTGRWAPKVTIDSATLMNKGLELIEAHHLFAMPAAKSMCWCIRNRSCTGWWSFATAR